MRSEIVEGRQSVADEAEIKAPSTEGREGRLSIADEVDEVAPSPPEVLDGGHARLADEVSTSAPSSKSGGAGQTSATEEVVQHLPTSPLIDQLAELQYRRKFYISLVNKQTNAAKALVRRALGWRYDTEAGDRDKLNGRAAKIVSAAISGKPPTEDADIAGLLALDLAVTAAAIEPCQKQRDVIEKEMKRLAKQLPVYDWVKGVRGFGELGLAVLVAEAGDPTRFARKDRLFKRLGLSPHGDKAYSTWRKTGGLTSEDWVAAGYSPRRRAEIFAVIGDPLFKQQSIVKGPYREAYDKRKQAAAAAHPDWTPMHLHMDAMRVMTKHLIRDFWVAWRRVSEEVPSEAVARLPAAELSEQEARSAKRRKVIVCEPFGVNGSPPSD